MKVILTKNNLYTHTISVYKADKLFDTATLDTKTYFVHDLTHFCVETELKLHNGFWGMINQGHKMQQLTGKTNELTEELRKIEHIVGATQSVFIGYMSMEMFYENLKTVNYSVATEFIENTIKSIRSIMNKWECLPIGESLNLEFSI